VSRPIITLTTDFGDSGHYLGAMRGVLLSACPDAVLVDITHRITPFSPLEASLVLAQACPFFPPGTVHLAVVDPGVGGMRKPILVVAGGHTFVGPDNGIFTPFFDGSEVLYRIREETGRPDPSATFHGRDLFAPVAARLACGEPPEAIGERIAHVVHLHTPRPRRDGPWVVGQVLYADHFGNLVTNIHRRDVVEPEGSLEIMVGVRRIPRLSRTYQDAMPGDSLALFGSSGYLEIAVAQGHAAAQLGMGKGERVRVRVHPPVPA
jgi:S-adenosylmethionine hydrolase